MGEQRPSPRYLDRGHDFPPARRFGDALIKRLPRPLWPGRWAARLGLQRGIGISAYRVEVPALQAPLRIAFASDFHAGPMTAPRFLDRAVEVIEGLRPDLLLLGGDFVSGRAAWAEPLIRRLTLLRPRLGTFAVLGNHDLWSDFDELEVRLLTAGVELLTNRSQRLPAPWERVTLVGLDDHVSGVPDTEPWGEAPGYRVLLMHSPSGLLDLGAERWDLALAGHTHGGQICLPGGRPLVLPLGENVADFCHGRFDPPATGGGVLIVSRGVGFSGVPLRLFAPPEVVEVRLVPAPAAAG